MRRLVPLALVALALGPAATGAAAYANPAWSPDGTKIAWTTDTEIWTANADGTGAAALATGFGNGLFQLVWPQLDALLFDANFQVFQLSASGGYHIAMKGAGFTFSADARGTRVASSCERCYGPVVVTTVATGKRVRFGGKGVAGGGATLSPDGSRIAFDRLTQDPKTKQWTGRGLWVARTNGTGLRPLDRAATCATWSPAGNLIAYFTAEKSSLALRVIAPDGTHRRLLLMRGPTCAVPAGVVWSPDGTRLAIVNARTGRLSLLDVASGRSTPVPAFASVTGVAWSPDGTRLLVAARPAATACS
ncbi:MAG TPA: hypothetical protein VGN27_11435, partial [Gaiellaceae bacterium]|nr:hypothetical protein [Gaiellaceae bacterium]